MAIYSVDSRGTSHKPLSAIRTNGRAAYAACHSLTTRPTRAYVVRMGVLSCCGVVLLALAVAGCGSAGAADNSKAREEYKARPACAGIVDSKAWTDCMERFKDMRPKHEPTTLIFKDWRA